MQRSRFAFVCMYVYIYVYIYIRHTLIAWARSLWSRPQTTAWARFLYSRPQTASHVVLRSDRRVRVRESRNGGPAQA